MTIYQELLARTREWTDRIFPDKSVVREMLKKKHRDMHNCNPELCAKISKRYKAMRMDRMVRDIWAKRPMTTREQTTLVALNATRDPWFAESIGVHCYETWGDFEKYLQSKGYTAITLTE